MNEAKQTKTVPNERTCPQCGAPLPVGALAGLCPACLLRQGASADTGTQPGAQAFEPPPVAEVAQLFPQLEILALQGKGGMGAVYKARQPALDRCVALKILPPQTSSDAGFAERFSREARALARLNHPNIVAVHDFGQVGQASSLPPESVQPPGKRPASLYYFIMEFVDGVNLRQLEQAGRLSPREALQIIPQICDALQYAHDEGVVHRDIKPENVLVDRKGRVKIADFGLAKILGREPSNQRLTGARDVMGTPHYMAPEQIEHPLTVDHRADIYSLGVVFYEMLTGELPLGRFPPPSSKVQVDVRLDEVVLHTLEKEPERRYQQVSDVKTAVETIVKSGSAGVPPAEPGVAPGSSSNKYANEPPGATPDGARGTLALPESRIFAAIAVATLLLLTAWGNATAMLVVSALGLVVGLVVFGRRAWRGALLVALAGFGVAAAVAMILILGRIRSEKSFYIGQAYFPRGDLIEITSVERTADQMTVRGHYHLVSHDQASLALHITSTNRSSFPDDARQSTTVSNGRGDFELVHSHPVPGLPHVNLYPVDGGGPFAELYFGTKAEAAEESKLRLQPQVSFGAVIERTLTVGLAIDFATGQVMPQEEEKRGGIGPYFPYRSMRDRGLDALCKFTGHLAPADMKVKPFGNESWDTLDPEQLSQTLRAINPVYQTQFNNRWMDLGTNGPTTYGFQTRNGVVGLLQLSFITNNPLRVKLRYKLVHDPGAATALQFRLVAPEGSSEPADLLSDPPGHRLREVVLDGASVARGGVDFVRGDARSIWVQFTPAGAHRFEAVTATNVGRQLAIVFREQMLSAPIIRTPIREGQVQIAGDFSAKLAHTIVDALNRASVPTGQAWTFTAPREQTVLALKPPDSARAWLDLDSGVLATNQSVDWKTRPGHEWIRTNGFDLVAAVSSRQLPVLTGFDLVVTPAPTNGWESVSATDVVQDWTLMQTEPQMTSTFGVPPGQSDCYLFQTREGGRGILQILGVTGDGRGVKIRYRLATQSNSK